jgi:hypothetical protein
MCLQRACIRNGGDLKHKAQRTMGKVPSMPVTGTNVLRRDIITYSDRYGPTRLTEFYYVVLSLPVSRTDDERVLCGKCDQSPVQITAGVKCPCPPFLIHTPEYLYSMSVSVFVAGSLVLRSWPAYVILPHFKEHSKDFITI